LSGCDHVQVCWAFPRRQVTACGPGSPQKNAELGVRSAE
jgi:hypothetical protein